MEADSNHKLLERARSGDAAALSELIRVHQPKLVRMVELRMDQSLRRRLDPADVVQDAALEIARRFSEWCDRGAPPFNVWLRLTTSQALAQVHRRHLGTRARDAHLDVGVSISRPSVSAANAAELFLASATSASQIARREELRERVTTALAELDDLDREIVALRHFEGLSNDETALELSITPAAASKRFVRALIRLRPALQALAPGESGAGR